MAGDHGYRCMGEHNALTYHFNIMNNITMVFCIIHVTIYFSQTRHASLSLPVFLLCFAANGSSDLYTYWRSYISLNTISMVFLILFAPNTTMSLVVMPVKYRLMLMFCVPTGGIYLYA